MHRKNMVNKSENAEKFNIFIHIDPHNRETLVFFRVLVVSGLSITRII